MSARKDSYPRGLIHVSDHAKHALEACRSPRVSAQGWPVATRPFHSTCAERAGKNVLNTPIGRLLKPGGALSTNGSMQSYQVRRIRSAPETTVSTAVERGSPERPNSAVITGALVSANAGNSNVSIVRWSQRATAALSLKMRVWPAPSSLWANRTWPAPDGHHRTRQWLKRSDWVLPPSWLRRMKEFSPVISTALGSTGGVMSSSLEGGYLDARVIVAGALGDIGVVGRAERGNGLAVVARRHPGTLECADDARRDRRGDAERQPYLAEIVPHTHPRAIPQATRARIVGMHLERRRPFGHVEPAEGRRDALVGGRRDQGQRIGRRHRPPARQPRAVLPLEVR